MKQTFVANLIYLATDGEMELDYGSSKIQTANVEAIRRFITNDFVDAFGVNSGERFIGSVLMYREFEISEPAPDMPISLANSLDLARDELSLFGIFLWFVKDNSVNTRTVFGLTGNSERYGHLSYEVKHLESNCFGWFAPTLFTEDEIRESIVVRDKFYKLCPKFKIEDHWGYDRDVNRIEKAFGFVRTARGHVYLPAKIASFMSAIECLFSTEAAEVTQKVCERVAFYLSSDNKVRKELFLKMKDAYDIRSSYLHGKKAGSRRDKEKGTIAYQRQICIAVDSIMRAILKRIIMVDSALFLAGDGFDTYLRDLIFSTSEIGFELLPQQQEEK